MRNKKSQVQMIETISVLLVFFILLVIGFVFFSRVQSRGIKADIEESVQKKAINIAQTASFLPELRCSEENIVKENCVDIEKVGVVGYDPGDPSTGIFKDNEDYYFDIFGYATINVERIYPDTPAFSKIIYNKSLSTAKSEIKSHIPILLKEPITKEYNFGLMTITTYSK